jgi:hypothetical protein
MSKANKVNKSNYDQGGRLTPDDLARERKKMNEVRGAGKREPGVHNGASREATGAAPGPSRPRSAPEE